MFKFKLYENIATLIAIYDCYLHMFKSSISIACCSKRYFIVLQSVVLIFMYVYYNRFIENLSLDYELGI